MSQENSEQIAYWNGEPGRRWARMQETQDRLLAPISQALIARAEPRPGERVIDIGCGCGATTLLLAAQVAPDGHVLGIDISEVMLARARERTPADAAIAFIAADATDHDFAAGSADLLFSRFGVMFFARPEVSFANLRRALKAGGRLAFACWREPKANPWLMLPLQAAYEHVPRMPEVGPDDPGPFGFAREERVRGILAAAGFVDIAMEPVDFMMDIASGRGLDAAVELAVDIGPASRAIDGQPEALCQAAAGAIRRQLAACQQGDSVPLAGGTWMVTARTH